MANIRKEFGTNPAFSAGKTLDRNEACVRFVPITFPAYNDFNGNGTDASTPWILGTGQV